MPVSTATIMYTFEPNRANFYWTIFDAESPFSIDSGKPPYTGLYRPNGPDSLTVFYGQQSYGTWQVRVKDWIYADTGTFKGVRLDFHINPEPSTALLFLAFNCAVICVFCCNWYFFRQIKAGLKLENYTSVGR